MFDIFRKRRIQKYSDGALLYLAKTFTVSTPAKNVFDNSNDGGIKYSTRRDVEPSDSLDDKYNSASVSSIMQKYNCSFSFSGLATSLDKTKNKTFVEAVIFYANRNGMKYSEIYKGAQIDRRLFSKIISDKNYKPSKDTAFAISLALHLSLEEANDLLSRAGYTFSKKKKKDIIVEYFFREQIYKLSDIDIVLYDLGEKIIGR